MSKTLNAIQTISKIGKILSKIVFICCIVGAVFCIVGLASLAVGVGELFKVGDVTVYGLIEANAQMSIHTMLAAMVTGAIICAGEAVLAKFAELYFHHELAAGTPFTLEGSKELMRLGILSIAIPVAVSVAAAIAYGILRAVLGDVAELDMTDLSVGLGITFIIMSLLCRYGAEQAEKKEA